MISLDSLRDLLDSEQQGRASRLFRAWHFLAVTGGVALATIGSMEAIWQGPAHGALLAALYGVLVAFAVEYALRLVIAGDAAWSEGDNPSAARLRWALSPLGITDLLTVVPIPIAMAFGLPMQDAMLFAVLWILKLARYSEGLAILGRVIRIEREPLLGVFLAFLIALFLAAVLVHLAEREAQPDNFGSLPKSLWWSITTLTTTGYGDSVPVTSGGRVIGGLVMICGIVVFALWAGILATGFSEEVRRREFLRTYDLIHKVPMFRELGPSLITEVARLLKTREFPTHATVMRRGQPGDCMYFIVSGEIEVRMEPKPLFLHAGSFFGEIAIITGGPRTATAVASKHSVLLMLDIADFRALAARRPELSKAIHEEADRRQKRDIEHGQVAAD